MKTLSNADPRKDKSAQARAMAADSDRRRLATVNCWRSPPMQTTAACRIPAFEIVQGRTALVVTDPQNDFLSPDGVTWGVVGKNIEANGTVEAHRPAVRCGQERWHAGLHVPRTTTIRTITAGNLKVLLKP